MFHFRPELFADLRWFSCFIVYSEGLYLETRLHPQGEVAPQEPIGTKLIRGADSFRSDVFFKVRGGCLSECDHCDVTNQLLNISHPPRTILLYSIIESFCLITGGWICDRPDG